MYAPAGCKPFTSACHPTRVTSDEPIPVALYATSRGLVDVPAHLLPPELVNRVAVPVPRLESLVVYPKNPVFTFALEPAGDDQVDGDAFVPLNASILFEPSTRGGSAAAFTVTVYPFVAFVVTVTSCAAILGTPLDNVPNGIVFAVDDVMSIVAPLTLPVFTAATENVNVEATDAVTAIDVVVKIAKATDALSITVEPVSEYVVILAKNVESVVEGFVMPEYDTVTA